MRLAAIASALAIVVCAAIFGAIFLQKTSVSPQAPLPAQAAPADRQAPAVTTADAPAMNASGAGATAPMVNAQFPAPCRRAGCCGVLMRGQSQRSRDQPCG